jgi:DNA-binding transcriptional MerR regulator
MPRSRRAKTPTARAQPIPEKAYFRIGEVARIAAVAPSVLRFWETQFRSLKPQKTRTNQRVYARRQVEAALLIRELLYDRGFTIAGARRRLAGDDAAPEADAVAPALGADADLILRLKKEVTELLQLVDG